MGFLTLCQEWLSLIQGFLRLVRRLSPYSLQELLLWLSSLQCSWKSLMSLTKHFDDELSYFLRKFITSSLKRGFITNTVPFCMVNSSECRKCLLNSCGARGLLILSLLKMLSDIILSAFNLGGKKLTSIGSFFFFWMGSIWNGSFSFFTLFPAANRKQLMEKWNLL